MRGVLSSIARKLITKGFRVGQESSADDEENFVLLSGIRTSVVTEHGERLLILDPDKEQVEILAPVIFPITGIYNQLPDQEFKIEGGSWPKLSILINYKDNSYKEIHLSNYYFYLDYQSSDGAFKEVYLGCDQFGTYFNAYEVDSDGSNVYDLAINKGEIVVKVGNEQTIAFSTSLSGVTNTSTEYRVKDIKVIGSQQPNIASPLEVVGGGVIGSLPIGPDYNQIEIQALRDRVEQLRDALASTQAQLIAALDAMRAHGLIATDQ